MKWQEKLNKKELRHLRESGVTTLRGAKVNAEHQAKIRAKNETDGLPPGIGEPCFDCKHINHKLGLPC